MSLKRTPEVRPEIRKVRLKEKLNTIALLAHAEQRARERHFDDFLIVDVDSHRHEFDHWGEIADDIDNRIIHHIATVLPTPPTILNAPPMYQEMGDHNPRRIHRKLEETPGRRHREID